MVITAAAAMRITTTIIMATTIRKKNPKPRRNEACYKITQAPYSEVGMFESGNEGKRIEYQGENVYGMDNKVSAIPRSTEKGRSLFL